MKLQYVHITKTGGSSLEIEAALSCKILWGFNNLSLWKKIAEKAKVEHKESWHTPLSLLDEDCLSKLLEQYVFFTIVRNPYNRAISEYYCTFGSRYFFQKEKIKSNDVDVFNEHFGCGFKKILNLFKSNCSKNLTHWQRQHLYTIKDKQPIIKNNNVIKYEDYQDSLAQFFTKNSIPIKTIKNNFRSSLCDKRFSLEHLSQDNIDLINEAYYDDFLTFGYEML